MALNYYWESFIRNLRGKPGARAVFENLMEELLRAENPEKNVQRVEANPGDDGIDIYVTQDNGIDIYQCKFFTDNLGDAQRNQIRKSFNRAKEANGADMRRWFLCMPREHESEDNEVKWINNFINKYTDYDGNHVKIQFIFGTEITNRIGKNAPGLIDKYFYISGHKHFTNKALIVPFTKENANGPQGGTYIPRDDLLSKIANSFQSQSGKERMVFLSGMGGCGKSELARAYAERHSSEYEEIFWLTCTDGIRPDLMTLMSDADTLCDVNKEDVAVFSDKVLIIVDNCNSDSSKFLRELEHGTGHADILVTTRLNHIGSYTNIIFIESDDPVKFTYAVFEKNYCRPQPWRASKEIKDCEIHNVYDICREVQYNTMIIALIGLRLSEYNNLSISDCAQKIRNGVGIIKGKIDYSKDLDPRSEEMKDVLRFLFQDILNYPVTIEQKEILFVLSLTPASWYEMEFIFSLTGDGPEKTDHEYAAKKLLSFGWLQGNNSKIAIHPLIAEVISDESIISSDSAFLSTLLNNYLGLQEKYLIRDRLLINEIIKRADCALPETKIAAMLLLNHGGYKRLFAELHPEVKVAYFVYINHDKNRYFMYRELKTNQTYPLVKVLCNEKDGKCANLLKVYNTGVNYTLDLNVPYKGEWIKEIPEGLCWHDLNIRECIYSREISAINDKAFCGCSSLSGELHLPESLTSIGDFAFSDCSNLSGELHLPESLSSIGDFAFSDCSNLSGELRLPKSLSSIGNAAFSGCSGFSGDLYLPESLTSIGEAAFSGCNGFSGSLCLPESLTNLGNTAFYHCKSLSGVLHLPESLSSIGDYAFFDCSNLSGELRLPKSLTSIGEAAFSRCNGFSGELCLPDSLTRIDERAFYGCSGFSGELHLPEHLTSLGDSAFKDCSSFSGELHLPKSLTSLGDSAFSGCSGLSGDLHLPDGLTSIGNGAFYECSGFSGELHLPKSLTSIGDWAFSGCSSLSGDLRLPECLTSLGDSAFSGCSGFSGKLYLTEYLTTIGHNTFSGCNGLSGELHLPKNLTNIGNYAFNHCSGLSGELHLPESLTSIGDFAFSDCSNLSGELHLPERLNRIGESAFSGCTRLSGELHLPRNLTYIGSRTFSNCTGFSGELRLPENLTYIGNMAFSGCSGFSGELHLPEGLTYICYLAFNGCSGFSGELYLPESLRGIDFGAFDGCDKLIIKDISKYHRLQRNAKNGTVTALEFYNASISDGGELQLPDSVTNIADSAFYQMENLSGELDLPRNLTSIGKSAFAGCIGLFGELHLPDSLTNIGDMAFARCRGFNGELHLPEHLTNLGDYAFSGCSGFSGKLHLPDSLTSIGDAAFIRCSGFSGELHLPHGLTSISNWTFCDCRGLSGELRLPKSLTSIGNGAFSGCSDLSGELHLPDSLTSIGDAAFCECSGFSGELHLPHGLTSINNGAFCECSGFSGELHLPHGLTSIGDGAFYGCSGFSGELHLPDGLTSIGNGAFCECSGFSGELHLPDSLTSIGVGAFSSCDRIETIYFHNINTEIKDFLSPYSDTIIVGYRYSTAEEYARENGLVFEELKPTEQ